MRIHEALTSGLTSSKSCLPHLIAPTSRFAKPHSITPGRWSTLGILSATYFSWARPLKAIHNINGSFSSFDFISHPWWRMLDASISLFLCLCIFVSFWWNGQITTHFFIWPYLGMVFPTDFSSFWELLFCFGGSKVCLKSTSMTAARSPWNKYVHHQWSKAAYFVCSKQD